MCKIEFLKIKGSFYYKTLIRKCFDIFKKEFLKLKQTLSLNNKRKFIKRLKTGSNALNVKNYKIRNFSLKLECVVISKIEILLKMNHIRNMILKVSCF